MVHPGAAVRVVRGHRGHGRRRVQEGLCSVLLLTDNRGGLSELENKFCFGEMFIELLCMLLEVCGIDSNAALLALQHHKTPL